MQRPGPPTLSQPYVHHRLHPALKRPVINIWGRQCIKLTWHCLCCPWKKLMIHDSQLCFNSNRRLVPSMGQRVWRWGGRTVGRSGDKASVCNTRPRERTMGDIEAAGHGAWKPTAVDAFVRTYIHAFWFTQTHTYHPLQFYKSLPITKEINFM